MQEEPICDPTNAISGEYSTLGSKDNSSEVQEEPICDPTNAISGEFSISGSKDNTCEHLNESLTSGSKDNTCDHSNESLTSGSKDNSCERSNESHQVANAGRDISNITISLNRDISNITISSSCNEVEVQNQLENNYSFLNNETNRIFEQFSESNSVDLHTTINISGSQANSKNPFYDETMSVAAADNLMDGLGTLSSPREIDDFIENLKRTVNAIDEDTISNILFKGSNEDNEENKAIKTMATTFKSLKKQMPSTLKFQSIGECDDATLRRIGQSIIHVLRKKKPECRIALMSLAVKNTTKNEMEKILKERITSREWSNANIHYLFPGPGEPVPPRIIQKRRKIIRDEVITDFVEWLYASDLLESLSFGQKVVRFSNGFHFTIKSIKRTDSFANIIRMYAQRWMTESINEQNHDETNCSRVNDIGTRCCRQVGHDGDCDFFSGDQNQNNESDNNQCDASCKKTGAQCFKTKGHSGQHAYTPANKLSPSVISKIVALLTNGEITSLAGLDNTDVIKGRGNFENMRQMAKKLLYVARFDTNDNEVNTIISMINHAESYHKHNFPRHLGTPGSRHKCTCFQCGFCHHDHDPIPCPHKNNHLPPCKECQESFDAINLLVELHKKVYEKLEKEKTFELDPCMRDDIDTWRKEIDIYYDNLMDYRSHIVQKEDEAIYDAQRYHDLDDNECIVIFDYKVSITSTILGQICLVLEN